MVNNDSMDMILAKAQTLIEALPYIQKFNGKRVVVKYGGSAMVDENLKYNVIKDVALLKLIGMEPIIVHGGGKEISAWLKKIGKESEFVNGLRVTDTRCRRDGTFQGQQEPGIYDAEAWIKSSWYQR